MQNYEVKIYWETIDFLSKIWFFLGKKKPTVVKSGIETVSFWKKADHQARSEVKKLSANLLKRKGVMTRITSVTLRSQGRKVAISKK